MATTRTGNFPIGFRRLGADWMKDVTALAAFANEHGLEHVDLHCDADACGKDVLAAGLKLGSVDLPDWPGLAAPDKARREEAVRRNQDYIETCAALGARKFFLVVQAEDGERSRAENFDLALEGYNALAPVLAKHEAWIVMEGCPGANVLACTPDSYRLFLAECEARVAVNYDPSHLIRMGIDPIRFLRAFAPHVQHVHAKDTELFAEAVYEHGYHVPPVREATHGFGGTYWRYAIPGHGCMRWREAFAILEDSGYQGQISIELEDEHFNGSEAGEQAGLMHACRFLAGC